MAPAIEVRRLGCGFLFLAAVIFGRWSPFGALAAAGLFGFTQALAGQTSSLQTPIPSELLRPAFRAALPVPEKPYLLQYGSDKDGEFAVYRLRPHEALYSWEPTSLAGVYRIEEFWFDR